MLVEAGVCMLRGSFVLVAFDAPIGIPASYLDAARTVFDMEARATFVDWLPAALARADFCDPVRNPEDWSPARPFFQVQAGEGGRKLFEVAAAAYGVDLWRKIERETRGNSVFAFGLPGQVAPAAQALWRELVATLDTGVAIWPFDGSIAELAARRSVIACEIYPRAAYATALAVALPARPRSIAKTNPEVRAVEVASLRGAEWVRTWEVEIEDHALAVESEDHFDALMTGAAVLRLTLNSLPLSTFASDSVAEGAIFSHEPKDPRLGRVALDDRQGVQHSCKRSSCGPPRIARPRKVAHQRAVAVQASSRSARRSAGRPDEPSPLLPHRVSSDVGW